METHHCELEENGVKLALTVIDTPGYGDAVDNTNCWAPILEYIEDQFDDFLEAETRVTRVEVCLNCQKELPLMTFCISGSGHSCTCLSLLHCSHRTWTETIRR